MKIELSHDILAKNIYDRASAEDKMLLKVASFIKGRYFFYTETRTLLTKEDINYIGPYIKKIQLSDEEWVFVKRSKNRVKIRRIAFLGTGFVVTTVFAGLFLWAETSREFAQYQKDRAENQTIKLEKKQDSLKIALAKFENEQKERKKTADSLMVRDAALYKSKDELAKAYATLQEVNERLREKEVALNKSLQNEKSSRTKLAELYAELEKTNTKLAKTNAELENKNNLLADSEKKTQSRALSGRALFVLRQDDNKKLAAQLASEAYMIDKGNKEACGILAELSGKGSDYFQKFAPPGSYEEMIEKLRKNYGKLDDTEKYKYLRGMPTEILQQKKGGR